jgi:hypothetical protein
MYYNKYLKYKNKYNNFKNNKLLGGSLPTIQVGLDGSLPTI